MASPAACCRRRCGPAFYPPGPGRGQFVSGRWGAQYPSLWVTRGGGGTFNNIWSPNTFAQSGFYVSDTTTPGHVYQLSVEHHLFGEIKLDRVENWDFNAPQTEEEAQTSPEAVAFEINASRNITIANYHALSCDAQPSAGRRRGAHDELVGHPLSQRAPQVGEWLRRVRRERLRPLPPRRQVPVRQRRAGRHPPSRGARPGIRGARRPGQGRGAGAARCVGRAHAREEARGRLFHDLRRRGRCRRHALLRRSPPAADLLLVGVARAGRGARRAARSGEPRRFAVRAMYWWCRLPVRRGRSTPSTPPGRATS